MVFKITTTGYPKLLRLALKLLLMDQKYDLLTNYIEFDHVQYGMCVPFPRLPFFPICHHIPFTYIKSVSVVQHSINENEGEKRYKP